jgi:hypothetical protein
VFRGAEIVALRDKIRVRDAEVAALGRRVHEQRSRIRSLEAGLAALGEKIARLR